MLVLTNRYDGIDLPDDYCRLLVIDSLPNAIYLEDIYEEQNREGSSITNIRIAQKKDERIK